MTVQRCSTLSHHWLPAAAAFVIAVVSCGDDDGSAQPPAKQDSGSLGSGGQAGAAAGAAGSLPDAGGGTSGRGNAGTGTAGGGTAGDAGTGGTAGNDAGGQPTGGAAGSAAGGTAGERDAGGGESSLDAGADTSAGGADASMDGSAGGPDAASDGSGTGDGGVTVFTSGGTISDPSGTLTLRIPPGALVGATTFRFTPGATISGLSGYVLVANTARRVEWSGAGFAPGMLVGLRVTEPVPFDPEGTAEAPGDVIVMQCQSGGIVVFDETTGDGYTFEQNGADLNCNFGPGSGQATVGMARRSPGPQPAILSQPENAAVLSGDNVEFRVNATGSAPLSYQWRRDAVNIPGQTAHYLNLSPVQPSDVDAKFSVVVSNSLGSVVSREVTVAICATSNLAREIVTFPNAGEVGNLVAGPDGKLWFTRSTGTVGNIDSADMITEFPVNGSPYTITDGSDGNLWFASDSGGTTLIGRITPTGTLTEFPTPYRAAGITHGADGNLWFTAGQEIGSLALSGTVFGYPIAPYAQLAGITEAPDGKFWFFDLGGWGYGFIRPDGFATEFLLPIKPEPTLTPAGGIALGSDGNLWFAERRSSITASRSFQIARVTPAGALTEFAACGRPFVLSPGPDGNLWFDALFLADGPYAIGKITPSGGITLFPADSPRPRAITAGPDGNVWYVRGTELIRVTPP